MSTVAGSVFLVACFLLPGYILLWSGGYEADTDVGTVLRSVLMSLGLEGGVTCGWVPFPQLGGHVVHVLRGFVELGRNVFSPTKYAGSAVAIVVLATLAALSMSVVVVLPAPSWSEPAVKGIRSRPGWRISSWWFCAVALVAAILWWATGLGIFC